MVVNFKIVGVRSIKKKELKENERKKKVLKQNDNKLPLNWKQGMRKGEAKCKRREMALKKRTSRRKGWSPPI